MAGGGGQARQVPAGRLAGFEADVDADTPTPSLPPRARVRQDTPAAPPKPVSTSPGSPSTNPRPNPPSPSTPTTGTGTAASAAPAAGRGRRRSKVPTLPSTVHLPIDLIEAVKQERERAGITSGAVFIQAIEATYEDLKSRFSPPTPAGGSLFAPRVTVPQPQQWDVPTATVNFRLTEADFSVLDELVETLGARSRGRLLAVALELYLKHER